MKQKDKGIKNKILRDEPTVTIIDADWLRNLNKENKESK